MAELNPNHPVTQAMHDHWHKICLLLMRKQGLQRVVITPEDIQATPSGGAIAVQEQHDGLHVFLVDAAEAQSLARKHGGLPQ